MPQERRTLLRWLLGGGFTASVLSFLYPAVKFMNPPTVPEASTNEVSAGKVQDLKPKKEPKGGSAELIQGRFRNHNETLVRDEG